MIPLSRRILSVETTSAMQATSKACGARSVHFVAPSQQPAPHAFETRERGEAAPADSAWHRVRPASPEQRVQDDGVDRGLINLFIQVVIERQFEFLQKEWMQGDEFIRLDPNDQDPINITGGERSQMSVPRQTAFPVRSSNVRESEGWRISVRARPKRA
jgi:hypothetical protein